MPYIGLCDYEQYDVQTFGKGEWINLLTKHGLTKYKFYYPFPDYKLPEIIYSDEHLPNDEQIQKMPIYLYGNKVNFDLRNTYRGLRDNGQFGFFSNSFLVECGTEECNLSNIIYAKELSYRTKEYQLITIENKNNEYYKYAASSEARSHLHTIHENYCHMKKLGIKAVSTELLKTDLLKIEFSKGENLGDRIYRIAKNRNWKQFDNELESLWQYYLSISEVGNFKDPLSPELAMLYSENIPILKLSLMDANVSNIMIDGDGHYVLIDQEWLASKQLPAEYLMFFSICHICDICEISSEKLMNRYNITKEKEKHFLRISEDYYRSRNIIDFNVQQKQNDLNWKWESGGLDTLPVCYYNTGNGFNENEKIYSNYYKTTDGKYAADFLLPSNVISFRLDPALCGERCMYYSTILINDKLEYAQENNIVTWEGKKMLNGKNPHLVFNMPITKFQMKIDLKQMTIPEIEQFLSLSNSNT